MESIEKWTGLLDLIMVKLSTTALMSLNVLATAVFYYATDMSDDDWVLVVPLW